MNENETIKTTSEETKNFNDYSSQGNSRNTKKGKMIGIISIRIMIPLIIALIYYFGIYTKAEQLYKRLIGSGIESLMEQNEKSNYETAKGTIKLDLDVKTEIEDIDENILDLINNVDITIGAQIDKNEKLLLAEIESDYNKEDMLDVKVIADAQNKETYLYSKQLLDKYLQVEIEEDTYVNLENIFEKEDETSIIQKIYLKDVAKELKKEFANIIKPEYCSEEKQTIQINEKQVSTKKNTVKMTLEQFINEYIVALDNLKENKKFKENTELLQIIEDAKTDMKENLQNAENSILQINIYTTGLIQKIVKVELVISDEYENELVTFAATKLKDDNYNFEILVDKEKIVNGTLNLKETGKSGGAAEIKIEMEEIGAVTLNVEYSEEYNTSIDKVDKNNSINIDEMTEDDQKVLSENLENSPIYNLISNFIEDDMDFEGIEDEDFSSGIDDSLWGEPVSSVLEDNQIIDYSGDTLITFGIPSGYTTDRISDTFQSLEKEDCEIDISTSYEDEEEYYNSLKNTANYFSGLEHYNNVVLSEKNTMTVGGRTFYYATLKYDYSYGSLGDTISTQYIWAKISDYYVIEFEISEPDKVTQDELNQLLTLTVEKK